MKQVLHRTPTSAPTSLAYEVIVDYAHRNHEQQKTALSIAISPRTVYTFSCEIPSDVPQKLPHKPAELFQAQ